MSIVDKVLGYLNQVTSLVDSIPLLKNIPIVGSILGIADQAVDFATAVRNTVGEKDQTKLDAGLAALEAKVAAHHASTMDKLTEAEDD